MLDVKTTLQAFFALNLALTEKCKEHLPCYSSHNLPRALLKKDTLLNL